MFSEFKNAVDSRDLSRQNRFEVFIPRLSRQENMLCQDVNLPAPSIITTDYKHQGPVRKIPYDVTFEDLTMTFLAFGDSGQPYGKFEDWIGDIYDDEYRFNDKSDYIENIVVKELDRRGSTIKEHTFNDAFPIYITKQKSMGGQSTPDTFDVQFSYLYKS